MTVRAPRTGYTLFELILVLAIIILLAAIAYPSLDGMYADFKVQAAADQVRSQCVTARTQAINEGRPYCFSVMPDGNRSRVAPLELNGGSANGNGERSGPDAQPLEVTLPKGVTFGAVENGPVAASQLANARPGGGMPGGTVSGTDSAGFTIAVVFLPNGEALEDKDIVISVKGAKPLVVRVRSLTGVVTVQKYQSEKGPP
jgi:type II secretory pathway pseudopilin PulG